MVNCDWYLKTGENINAVVLARNEAGHLQRLKGIFSLRLSSSFNEHRNYNSVFYMVVIRTWSDVGVASLEHLVILIRVITFGVMLTDPAHVFHVNFMLWRWINELQKASQAAKLVRIRWNCFHFNTEVGFDFYSVARRIILFLLLECVVS